MEPASYEDQEHDRRLLRKFTIKLLNQYRWVGENTMLGGHWLSVLKPEERDALFEELDGLKVKYE